MLLAQFWNTIVQFAQRRTPATRTREPPGPGGLRARRGCEVSRDPCPQRVAHQLYGQPQRATAWPVSPAACLQAHCVGLTGTGRGEVGGGADEDEQAVPVVEAKAEDMDCSSTPVLRSARSTPAGLWAVGGLVAKRHQSHTGQRTMRPKISRRRSPGDNHGRHRSSRHNHLLRRLRGCGLRYRRMGPCLGGAPSGAPIDHAIAPVLEANHTWLIFCLVLLWSGFPWRSRPS